MCEYCETKVQDIKHLLYECKVVKPIWMKLMHEYVTKNNLLVVNLENIVYILVHPKASHAINLIVLITKQYIFWCKCENKTPTITGVKNEINFIYNVELYNARICNKVQYHINKWSPVKASLVVQ